MPESISATRTSGLPPVISCAATTPVSCCPHCWPERLSGVAGLFGRSPGSRAAPAAPATTTARNANTTNRRAAKAVDRKEPLLSVTSSLVRRRRLGFHCRGTAVSPVPLKGYETSEIHSNEGRGAGLLRPLRDVGGSALEGGRPEESRLLGRPVDAFHRSRV